MVTSVYIVRHCEAEGNISETFQGSIDSNITEKGALQLEKLSERFKNVEFDILISSPLKRAYKTAEAINRYYGHDIIIDPGFAEIDGGELEGHKWDELPKLFPDTYSLWKTDFASFHAKGGESMQDVYDRVSKSVMNAVKKYSGKTIVIASHGGAIRNLLCFLDNKPLSEIGDSAWVENTSVSRYDFDENFEPHKVFVNDFSHLDTPETAPHAMWWRSKK